MAYTNIDLPTDYFNTVLYTGTGASNARTGVGFQPDWVWIKGRSGATDHGLYDAVRGVQNQLESNTTTAETAEATGLTAFGTDGFTVGALAQLNTSSATYVAWNWLANGAGVAGDNSSTISANSTAGFSIIKYTGNGDTSASAPSYSTGIGGTDLVIYKRLDSTGGWTIQCRFLTISITGSYLLLNSTIAQTASGTTVGNFGATIRPRWTDATNGNNINGASYIAYCFVSKKGFSKIGSYTGNGSTDGTFVYTGFKPAFVIIKPSSYANSWLILDNKRNTFNPVKTRLEADGSGADSSTLDYADFLSNGFKIRTSNGHPNTSGGTLIYMAFAENPFVTSGGIPVTAR
jgi:hypothetical protein